MNFCKLILSLFFVACSFDSTGVIVGSGFDDIPADGGPVGGGGGVAAVVCYQYTGFSSCAARLQQAGYPQPLADKPCAGCKKIDNPDGSFYYKCLSTNSYDVAPGAGTSQAPISVVAATGNLSTQTASLRCGTKRNCNTKCLFSINVDDEGNITIDGPRCTEQFFGLFSEVLNYEVLGASCP